MKTLASVFLVFVLVLCLAACNTSSAPTTNPTTEPTTAPTTVPTTPVHTHTWQDANCTTPKTCTTCGATEGEPAEHQWEDATCTTPPICTACGHFDGDALGHVWDDGNIVREATEEAAGEILHSCTVCGDTETRVIPVLNHVHEYSSVVVTEPGCTNGGYTTYTCRCGDSYTDNETPDLGHAWRDATCTTPKTCAACGVAEGAVLSHNYTATTTPASCTQTGSIVYSCAMCGDSYSESLPMTEHVFADGACIACHVPYKTLTNGTWIFLQPKEDSIYGETHTVRILSFRNGGGWSCREHRMVFTYDAYLQYDGSADWYSDEFYTLTVNGETYMILSYQDIDTGGSYAVKDDVVTLYYTEINGVDYEYQVTLESFSYGTLTTTQTQGPLPDRPFLLIVEKDWHFVWAIVTLEGGGAG